MPRHAPRSALPEVSISHRSSGDLADLHATVQARLDKALTHADAVGRTAAEIEMVLGRASTRSGIKVEVNHLGLMTDLVLTDTALERSLDELRAELLTGVGSAVADATTQVTALRNDLPAATHPADQPSVVLEFLEQMNAAARTSRRGE